MSDYLRYPQGGNTRMGKLPYPTSRRPKSKSKGKGGTKNKVFYNILDLLGAQNKRPPYSAARAKPKPKNINRNEHMAHKGLMTGVGMTSPMPGGSGLEIPQAGSIADFMGQAAQLVNPQYDAAIAAINELQNAKRARASSNKQVLGDMFNQLSKFYSTDAQKAAGTIYDTAQSSVATQGKDAQSKVAATYTAMQDTQRKEAEKLGIQDLGLDEQMAEQDSDEAFVRSIMEADTKAVQGNLSQGRQSMSDFNASSANVAKLEGSEQQAALMRMLEDYLGETDAQKATIEGQRAGSLHELAMQLAQQDFENQMMQYNAQIGQQDRSWDREMQMMQLQAQMAEAEAQRRSQASEKEKPEDPWSKVADYAERVQPGYGKNIMAVLNQNMQDEELQELLNNRARPVTPASFARYFNSQNRRGTGADSAALNQAAQYLYTLLYGKG